MSIPPPVLNGSAGADLAVFMHPSTPWDTEWYASDPRMPPHLNGSPEIRFTGSFSHTESRGVTRWARFRPRPEPMSGAALQQAAETHGAAVAEFAERAVASGRPVARGE